MKEAKPKNTVDLSEENWCELIGYNLIDARPAETLDLRSTTFDANFDSRPGWPVILTKEENVEFVNRTAPVLIATGFFEKTKYKRLAIFPTMKYPWDVAREIHLRNDIRTVFATRELQVADCTYMDSAQFLNFLIGIAAEVILAVCEKYKLNIELAQKLAEEFPVAKIPLTITRMKATIPLPEPPTAFSIAPLTDEELVFTDANLHSWCVEPPFTDERLSKIGTDTLSVMVPYDLSTDDYVRVATALFRAPQASVRFWHSGSYEVAQPVIQYFRHVGRVCFNSLLSPELLQELSPDLVRLEVPINATADLGALTQFKSLQLLRLEGQKQELAAFPQLLSLRALCLSGVQLKNLSLLNRLYNLQSLAVTDCKLSDLEALSSISGLKYLGLASLAKLSDLSGIENLDKLEYLHLLDLPQVEAIPSLKKLTNLRRLSICGLKNLTDLAGIAEAPNLEEIILFNMTHLTVEHAAVLRKSEMLKAARTDHLKVEKALALPRTGTGSVFKFSAFVPADLSGLLENQLASAAATEVFDISDESETDTDNENNFEELRVHMKVTNLFGQGDELVHCHEIGDRLEQLLQTELLGTWDGEETGMGYHTIFFVGADSKAMFAALKTSLKKLLPKGSFVEIEDSDEKIKRVQY